MLKTQRTKQYDLEDRTLSFAKENRSLIKLIPRTVSNIEDGKQLARSSGSVGANYIEANEALSKKDFIMRLKISRKEVKESRFWLKLIDAGNNDALNTKILQLIQESTELMNIFGAIIRKSEV
jgi:four helix bundle protein